MDDAEMKTVPVTLTDVPFSVTCGACGKVERSSGVLLAGTPTVYALPAGWMRYPGEVGEDDHYQCAECEAEPF